MNQRDRRLMLGLIGVPLLLGCGYLAYLQMFSLPEYDQEIEQLDAQISGKELEVRKVLKDQTKLALWKQLSLPEDPHLARTEYDRYLWELLRGKFTDLSMTPSPPQEVTGGTGRLNKKLHYTALVFNVRGKTTLENLAQVLTQFQKTPLVHKVKSLSLERANDGKEGKDGKSGRPKTLQVRMTVEALIVAGAGKVPEEVGGVDSRLVEVDALAALARAPVRVGLLAWALGPRGPVGVQQLALVSPSRSYTDIARKDVFNGAPPPAPEVVEREDPPPDPLKETRYVFFTNVTRKEVPRDRHPETGGVPPGLFGADLAAGLRQAPVGLGVLAWAVGPGGPAGPPRPTMSAAATLEDRQRSRTIVLEFDAESGSHFVTYRMPDGKEFRRETDTFVISEDGSRREVIRCQVLRIAPRDVYFQSGEKVYGLHVGYSLPDALRSPLEAKERAALGLPEPAVEVSEVPEQIKKG